MSTTLIRDVADTAFLVAAHRAIESERPDALFRDPLADRLAGEHGRRIAAGEPKAARMSGWAVAVRTCIIDDYIRLAIERGVDTVLNLGAGLDTRPYRMALPESLLWVEVDYPRVIDYKESRLAGEKPVCRLERIRLDLADEAARRSMLSELDSRAGTVLVLTEGVVPYLGIEEAASLADDLASLRTVRYWVVDYFSPATYKFRERRDMKRHMQNAPFRFQPADYFAFFQQHGWRAGEVRYIADEAERLGRPIPLPAHMRWLVRLTGVFTPREKRTAFRRFAGYVLLEPVRPAPAGR